VLNLVLAADATPGQGLGHLSRSSALAAALSAAGCPPDRCLALGAHEPITVDSVTWEPAKSPVAGPDEVLVLDSYSFGAEALPATRALAVFHDEGTPPARADLVIAPALAPSEDPRLLTGLEHACLRPSYWDLPARDVPAEIENVLVTTGGADPGGTGAPLAAAIAARLPGCRTVLVRGPQADANDSPPGVTVITGGASLTDVLLAADMVVTAAGQTLLEALATGAPTIALALAPNQRPVAEQLAARDAAVLATDVADAAARAELLAYDEGERRRLGTVARATVDGRGAHRVAARVAALS
jgi:spore coat polysaccharide biosynthesis predicted glycosyltransferase SpsG